MARVIDLSMPIQKHWRWYSGTFLTRNHEEGELFRQTTMLMGVHGFAHVDAPGHFVKGGPTIDQLPIDLYCGDAAVVDLTRIAAGQPVTPADLEGGAGALRAGDIALLRTDWPRRMDWRSPAFWAEAPYLTAEACQWLLAKKVKVVGLDFPADYILRFEVTDRFHKATAEENTTHYNLLANGVGLLEYLINLDVIVKPRVRIYALPLNLIGSDGSPVRAVAVEDDL